MGRHILCIMMLLGSLSLFGCQDSSTDTVPAIYVETESDVVTLLAKTCIDTNSYLHLQFPDGGSTWDITACIDRAARCSVAGKTMLEGVRYRQTQYELEFYPFYAEATQQVQGKKDALSVFSSEWAYATEGFSDAEKVLLAYLYFRWHCQYSDSGTDAHHAYGALIEGQAVCDGYAEGFAYCMEAADIPCRIVSGFAGTGLHCWNMVKVDGMWYHVDCTWGQQSASQLAYFLKTDSEMEPTHRWQHMDDMVSAKKNYNATGLIAEMQKRILENTCNQE